MVTCAPMSAHWAWVPPEDHTNTGRLGSAGSRSDPVPRRQRLSAALRLPAPISHGSGPPCQWPPSMRALVLCLLGRRHVRPQRAVRRRRVTGSPHNRSVSRRGEGLPGYGAVLFVRAMVEHPAGYHPLLAQKLSPGMVVAFRENRTLGIREGIGFGAAFPWPTCSHAYASPAVFPRPAQGLLPARAGSPLAGRDSHPLDDEQSFMEVSHPPIPFDPQGLVAL